MSHSTLANHRLAHRIVRFFSVSALLGLTTLFMACPQKQQAAKIDYTEAERNLRMAININEVAYNSWNKVYEELGTLKQSGKISEARWAAVTAVDGVIVLSEADLIEGIDRSKRLLDNWKRASTKLLSAENIQEVAELRERERAAREDFAASIEFLNARSLKLRDSYSEAMLLADKASKEGLPIPNDHLSAIRQVVKMVDEEIAKQRGDTKTSLTATPKASPSPLSLSVK
ncbi:MAG TPA: hypothetical protein VEF04_12085 [Blastocatellia bacterium]|nr:hypothetical protein [Blastocatellia bacterium]